METYQYLWWPVVVVVGTALILTNAFLALIVLILVLPALLAAVAAGPYLLGRYVVRRWREHDAVDAHDAWSAETRRGSAR